MATATTKNITENNMPEVFVRTPEALEGGITCDSCGHAVAARYTVSKNDQSLFFCGHHVRSFAEKLKAQGFTISPERYDFAFTG
jgi:hypothetical protein